MSLKNQLNQLYQISEAQQRAQHGMCISEQQGGIHQFGQIGQLVRIGVHIIVLTLMGTKVD